MFTDILLAYDGTPAAETAFRWAVDLAKLTRHPLHVVAVAWTAEVETRVGLDREIRRCWSILGALRTRGERERVELEIEVAEGIAAERIVKAAGRIPADLIVIGLADAA